jgi:hypothetical protein
VTGAGRRAKTAVLQRDGIKLSAPHRCVPVLGAWLAGLDIWLVFKYLDIKVKV